MNFEFFKQDYFNRILPNKPEYIREGQALMNYLSGIWFNEYERLSSVYYYEETNIDCFYNDKLISNTLKHLEKVWENYPN